MHRRALPYLAGGLALRSLPTRAQDLSQRATRMVVPFAPGGTTDILARLLSERFQAEFGQPLVLDLRPGAGGTIGTHFVAQQRPDGATLLMGTPGTHATATALYPNLPYDPVRDFAPVALIASVPNIVVVHPALPIHSIADLIAAARAAPGRINYGSAGTGATTHLSGELFRLMTGSDIVHVPYRGSGAALTDLMGGQIQMMFENLPGAIQHVREGRLRAIAVTSAQRSQAAPEFPSVAETVPGYEVNSWFAVFAPAGTPRPTVLRLNQGLRRILAEPAMALRFRDLGAERGDGSPEDLATLIGEETARWAQVIRTANITLQ
ncbi:tripartite tricarboxylate transporter substrate binding protein [Sediminicoccus sp. KRV36]|uniref:tripartite tricarboxylate transporter substrate binding protein n=1 Tax=Sediminicoccus sp. KRV36 TaxID=3133721 RepID=UPI00200C11A6|nr:tripartite tricarboxylate transporter substrate binding protein [Sediminicoccus rosea]UPY35666.1 tripartite tricarboxylate transporter substrate binding protein [Sediminicoccus rosea]